LILSLLLLPVLLYLTFCAILFFAQTSLLFPISQVGPAGPLPPGAERLELAAASGERLAGLHIPPAQRTGERLLLLGFGGNATNAQATATLLHDLYPQADIVAFHYRGYPPSEGNPSAAAFTQDALLVHDFARAHFRAQRVIAVGFSIGGGVAAALAAQRPLDGLILVTPFDSLGRVAGDHYPWLPVRLLFRHELEPALDLRRSRTPVAIIAGGGDTLIPPARTDALRRSIPRLVFDRTLAGSGHNDIYAGPAFAETMRQAYSAVMAAAAESGSGEAADTGALPPAR
jgi:pimeloyl-ACP methyl ester carboxylesterase